MVRLSTKLLHGVQTGSEGLKVRINPVPVLYLLTVLLAELETVLLLAGAITPQETPRRERRDSDDENEDSSDEASSRMRSAGTRTNRSTGKNIRKKEEDSDSDFDL